MTGCRQKPLGTNEGSSKHDGLEFDQVSMNGKGSSRPTLPQEARERMLTYLRGHQRHPASRPCVLLRWARSASFPLHPRPRHDFSSVQPSLISLHRHLAPSLCDRQHAARRPRVRALPVSFPCAFARQPSNSARTSRLVSPEISARYPGSCRGVCGALEQLEGRVA